MNPLPDKTLRDELEEILREAWIKGMDGYVIEDEDTNQLLDLFERKMKEVIGEEVDENPEMDDVTVEAYYQILAYRLGFNTAKREAKVRLEELLK